jgi:hypothetical protein
VSIIQDTFKISKNKSLFFKAFQAKPVSLTRLKEPGILESYKMNLTM